MQTPTPPENEVLRPKPTGLYDASSGRIWPLEAVNRFVVGRMYGSYDFDQSCLHLDLAYEGFASLTSAELLRFWNVVVTNSPIFSSWNNKSPEDTKVKEVLEDIKALMEDKFYDADCGDLQDIWVK